MFLENVESSLVFRFLVMEKKEINKLELLLKFVILVGRNNFIILILFLLIL